MNLSQYLLFALMPVLAVMAWQQVRYHYLRREVAQDWQNPVHDSEAFHILLLFSVKPGNRVIDSARHFAAIASSAGGKLVYAGEAAFTADAAQLGPRDWDGVLLLQFRNRLVYEERSEVLASAALDLFGDHYLNGMRRNRTRCFWLPQVLLRIRLAQLLTGHWRAPVLEEQPDYATSPRYDRWRDWAGRLRAIHKVNPTGLVVVELIKRGTPQQRVADLNYHQSMLERMAIRGHGPLHIGRSIALQGNARFDEVRIVQYPSASYFADLVTSSFYHELLKQKRVGDATWIPTVPLTYQL